MPGPPTFSRTANFGYDLANWPYKFYLPFGVDTLTGTPFTLTPNTQIVRVSHQFDATTRFMLDEFPTALSDTTNLTLLNEGDDTDYSRELVYYTPVDAIIDRLTFNIAMGLQVSAYTSGNFRISRVKATITAWKASGQKANEFDINMLTSGTTAMTAVDNQFVIFNETYTQPLPLYAGGALSISIDTDKTVGVGTYQQGIVDVFPYANTGGLRTYSQSGVMVYARPNTNKESNMYAPTYFAGVM